MALSSPSHSPFTNPPAHAGSRPYLPLPSIFDEDGHPIPPGLPGVLTRSALHLHTFGRLEYNSIEIHTEIQLSPIRSSSDLGLGSPYAYPDENLPPISSLIPTPPCSLRSFETSFSLTPFIDLARCPRYDTRDRRLALPYTPPRTASPADTIAQELTAQDLRSIPTARTPRHTYDDDEVYAFMHLKCIADLPWEPFLWYMHKIFRPGAVRRTDVTSNRALPPTYQKRDVDGCTSKYYRLRKDFGLPSAGGSSRHSQKATEDAASVKDRKQKDRQLVEKTLEDWMRRKKIVISPDVIAACHDAEVSHQKGLREWEGTPDWAVLQENKRQREVNKERASMSKTSKVMKRSRRTESRSSRSPK